MRLLAKYKISIKLIDSQFHVPHLRSSIVQKAVPFCSGFCRLRLERLERLGSLHLCLHGFPDLAYSYRKVLGPLAAAGYHVVAYDQRGYGRTTGWDNRAYDSIDLNTFRATQFVKDAVVLVQTLGYSEVACVIGNDVGAAFAPLCALIRPDIFKS